MVIRVTNFGGLYPRAQPRALPADGAQAASNLLATTREFRPLASDTTVVSASGVSNPLTIFRLQRKADGTLNTDFTSAAAWKTYAAELSFAKGQLNDDLTDRHYYTRNDGSAPPRWLDATGEDRPLGVPAPEAAPAVVVNVVDEFTPDDRGTALDAARQQVLNIVRSNASPVWRGAAHPGTGVDGYADQVSSNGFAIENPAVMIRAYRLSGAGGVITDSYCAADESQFSWVFDPLLAGHSGPAAAAPAWAGGAGTEHYYLSFSAYGLTYNIDTGAIQTALEAIAMPGTDDGTKLFTSDQVDTMTATLDAYADPDGPVIKPRIDALASAVNSLKALLDGGQQFSLVAQTTAFYSKTDVAAEIDAALANAKEAIWAAADAIARSSLPPDFGGAGS